MSSDNSTSKVKVVNFLHDNDRFYVYEHYDCVRYFRNLEDYEEKAKMVKNVVCGYCDEMFENNSKLFFHMDLEHKENRDPRQIECRSCGNKVAGKTALILHLQNYHGGERIGCSKCQETFENYLRLIEHCYSIHSVAGDLACDLCDDVFTLSDDLVTHVKDHVLTLDQRVEDGAIDMSTKPALPDSATEETGEELTESSDDNDVEWQEEESNSTPGVSFEPSVSNLKEKLRSNKASKRMSPDKESLSKNKKECEEKTGDKRTGATVKHTCYICKKAYSRKSALKLHIETNHCSDNPGTSACNECTETFTKQKELKNHRREVHGRRGSFQCKHCLEIFEDRTKLYAHLTLHDESEKTFRCRRCDRTFSQNSSLKYHNITVHSESFYECKYCDSKFTCKRLSTDHMLLQHFKCDKCGQKCKSLEDLSRHAASEHPTEKFECDLCGGELEGYVELLRHVESHKKENLFFCKFCNGRFFKDMRQYKRHQLAVHSGEKRFFCPDCNRGFYFRTTFIKHVEISHGTKKFSCKICFRLFPTNSRMNQHIRVTHDKIKNFQCHICEKSFCLRGDLNIHFLTHTGEKRFLCSVCGMGFGTASNLRVHNRNVHLEERPFKCTVCEKAFKRKAALQEHNRSHTGERRPPGQQRHACQFCDVRYVKAITLRRHVSKCHAGEIQMPNYLALDNMT